MSPTFARDPDISTDRVDIAFVDCCGWVIVARSALAYHHPPMLISLIGSNLLPGDYECKNEMYFSRWL
jgi:hypothetical protein